MKQNLKKTALAIGILALGIAGCKKEAMQLNYNSTDNTESQIQSLTQQAEIETTSIEMNYDEATSQMSATNDGLAADYHVYLTDLNENERLSGSDPDRNEIKKRSFIPCLRALNLDSSQLRKIKIALGNYEDCKVHTLKRARTIHEGLKEKYKSLAMVQAKLLRDGSITKEEYNERILRLKKAFAHELREAQIREKVSANLRECYEKYLRQLHSVLTERQWQAFINCKAK